MTSTNSGRRFGSGNRQNSGRRNASNNYQRRNDNRNRNMGAMQMGSLNAMSPWETGMNQAMQHNIINSYGQIVQPSPFMPRSNDVMASMNYGAPNKIRRLDRSAMDSYDQRGSGLLPSPGGGSTAMGSGPLPFSSQLQQRLGAQTDYWGSPYTASVTQGAGASAYFPSNSQFDRNRQNRQNNQNPRSKRAQSRLGAKVSSSSDVKNRIRTNRFNQNKKTPDDSKSKEKKTEKAGDDERSEDNDEKKNKDTDVDMKGEESVELENGEKTEKSDEATDKKKEKFQFEDSFPIEALYCSVCDLANFNTVKGYIRHLKGVAHAKMAEMFHAKNAATLELLNISAKLASTRRNDKYLRNTGKRALNLKKTTEQALLQRWMKINPCCGTKYNSPFELEEHKLSLNHLKAQHELELKKKAEAPVEEEEEEDVSKDELISSFKLIDAAKQEEEKEPLTSLNIQPLDSSKPFGLHYMTRMLRYHCSACKGPLMRNMEEHCQSPHHYEAITAMLKKKQEQKDEVEESERKAKEKALKDKEAEEKSKKDAEEKSKKDAEEEAAKKEDEDKKVDVEEKAKEVEDADADDDDESMADLDFDVMDLENELVNAPEIAAEQQKTEEASPKKQKSSPSKKEESPVKEEATPVEKEKSSPVKEEASRQEEKKSSPVKEEKKLVAISPVKEEKKLVAISHVKGEKKLVAISPIKSKVSILKEEVKTPVRISRRSMKITYEEAPEDAETKVQELEEDSSSKRGTPRGGRARGRGRGRARK